MSQNIYYEDVRIIKKPLKKRLKSIFIFLLIFSIFGGIVVSAMYLSRSIAVSNVGSIFVYGGTTIKLEERVLYGLSMGSYDSREEAESVALGATIQGAGGYIWQEDKNYVIGSIYSTKEDSELVKNNLSGSKYDLSILKITMPKLTLSFEDMENKSVSYIHSAINFFGECYKQLYDYSIKFDRGEINNLAISSGVSELRGQAKVFISNIQVLLNSPHAKLQTIQNALIELDELLNETIIKTIDNTATNSSLKYSMCKVVNIEYNMRNKML